MAPAVDWSCTFAGDEDGQVGPPLEDGALNRDRTQADLLEAWIGKFDGLEGWSAHEFVAGNKTTPL